MLLNLLEESTPVIIPTEEIAAYEALWTRFTGFGKLADLFKHYGHDLPSQVVATEGIPSEEVASIKAAIAQLLPFHRYAALFYNDFEYPQCLKSYG